jgi:type IV secretion system protein VirB10
LLSLSYIGEIQAADPDSDFSGTWVLDTSSNAASLGVAPDPVLTLVQQDTEIQCSATPESGSPKRWSYSLAGKETKYRMGDSSGSSVTKWEGAALLINTLVSGPQNYTVMDRWRLSRDHATLTMTRQVIRGTNEAEGTLTYRREGAAREVAAAAPPPTVSPAADATASPATLGSRTTPPSTADILVPAGTRIPLALRTAIDTRHSREGDRVYLETVYPVSINGRVVIPRGSFVNGTLTVSKPAGTVKGKGELFIRFDSLTLPNGVTRDFLSRLDSVDGTIAGKVDRKEGTISGERDKAGEAKTTAAGAGIGASVGSVAGAAAGSPLAGAGIGAAAGAAAGLASVLVKHRPDVSLPIGTSVEMVLDRDLHYQTAELRSAP